MAREVVYEGMRTPWGTADSAQVMAEGIGSVSTPSHGGIKLSPARNRLVPAPLRREGGWYEEDCDALIPCYVFHAELSSKVSAAPGELLDRMRRWYPEQVDAAYPAPTARADSEPYDPGDPEPDGVRCDTCRGNGVIRCSGKAYRFPERAQEAVRDGRAVDCPDCHGTGILGLLVCPCGGHEEHPGHADGCRFEAVEHRSDCDALLQAAKDSGHLQVVTIGR